MHNLFNFSSFNIALNEMGCESFHAFRSNLACEVYPDVGWGSCPPLAKYLSSSAGLSGLRKPSFPTIDDTVTSMDFPCSPCRPLEGCVSEICQDSFNEQILGRFESISSAANTFSSQLSGSVGAPSLPIGSRFSILSSPFKVESFLCVLLRR